MPNLAPLSDDQATGPAQQMFQAMQAKLKMVPNIFRTMAHSPAVLKATLDLNQAIQHDLDPKLRELAYLKASTLNHCDYCLHYHKTFARQAGLGDPQLLNLSDYRGSSAYTDVEKAVLQFAEQWTLKGKVDPDVVARLSRHLTPTQLVTLAATVALANWTNRFNVTFNIELP
jgi:uncharacterized peroxidase-related enzyme